MASDEQWNVSIRLPDGEPTHTNLASGESVKVASGVNIQLDTNRSAVRFFSDSPKQTWLTIGHTEPRSNARIDLDLRYYPLLGRAAPRKSKKRSLTAAAAQEADGASAIEADGAPPKKKAKPSSAPQAELETTPKKKRPPSTKPRAKKAAAGAGNGAGAAVETQDGLSLLFDEIGPLDT